MNDTIEIMEDVKFLMRNSNFNPEHKMFGIAFRSIETWKQVLPFFAETIQLGFVNNIEVIMDLRNKFDEAFMDDECYLNCNTTFNKVSSLVIEHKKPKKNNDVKEVRLIFF